MESGNLLDLGSDHKCLTASFSFESCNHNQKTKGRRKPNIASPWPPRSLQQYTEQLQQELDGINPRETVEMRHCKIQEAMISASHQQGCDRHANSVNEDRHELLEKLIAERKTLPSSNATQRGQLSKAIRKELRRIREEARCQKIHGLLSNFSQLKAIGGIKYRKKKHMTIQMEDSHGKTHSERRSIMDIFAKFYEDLYSSKLGRDESEAATPTHSAVPPFTEQDIIEALQKLKSGKAKDAKGLVAEMLKNGGRTLRPVLLDLLNEIFAPSGVTPKGVA